MLFFQPANFADSRCLATTLIDDYFFIIKQLGKAYGVESFVLSPKESKELYPLLNVDDLYGTLHSPGDGTIDPASWATTLTRAAMKNGAKVKMSVINKLNEMSLRSCKCCKCKTQHKAWFSLVMHAQAQIQMQA